MAQKPVKTFWYRGLVERPDGKGSYLWREGYSEQTKEGFVQFPWRTYRECQQDAKADGFRAKFIKTLR